MHRERMERILTLAKSLDPVKVDMSNWYSTNCQTTACVIGHAAQNEWFIKQGLVLLKKSPFYKNTGSWAAVMTFFDIEYGVAKYCFEVYSLQEAILNIEELLNE